MERNEEPTELWLFPTGFARGRARTQAAPADRGRQGQRPTWSPDGRCDRVHGEAQGRRRAAGLPDRARRRRGARLTDISTGGGSINWFPDGKRVAFVSWVWPDLATDAAQAKRHEGAQGRQGQGARDRARRVSLLGPLAHRRPRAARLRLRRRDGPRPRRASRAPGSRCRRGTRRPTTSTSRPTAARSRSPSTSATSRA